MLELLEANSSEQVQRTEVAFGPWSCCSSTAETVTHPDQLTDLGREWLSASVPGTVAGALHAGGQWNMSQPPSIDTHDWWYRTTFARPGTGTETPCEICFDGLAGLAEVWLNGERLLRADNMFRSYRVDVSTRLLDENELVIGFRSLTTDLQKKRPRPRWKTNLVNHQQLRWHRTTLLGRIPGWSPPVPAIGPWRATRVEQTAVQLAERQLRTHLDGTTGIVTLQTRLRSMVAVDRVILRVGKDECLATVCGEIGNQELHAELRIADAPLWWPHTHGEQRLLSCDVIVESGAEERTINCGRVGFRQLTVDRKDGFAISINGEPVYCRGACWTVADVFNLTGTEQSLRRDLTLVRDAGANMVRVIGTMVYESDLFYSLCDELGLMVWQDFMFANMDYPVDDPDFAANITGEATEQLRRLAGHPSVVVCCGNSEIEQQAAMLGMPRELWSNSWFSERLPALCAELHPTAAYVPSTPTGGVLPFHASSGISHFYGVGAYLRSPAELRQANVKFTSECLGFANIPETSTIDAITDGGLPITHHPRWKQRVPRDNGAGWDFEDVRDHYLKHVYGLDPIALRSTDLTRYMDLSRVVSGEMMAQTFAEWRSVHSQNRGALVWFFKDLWPAAGWGVIDSEGLPKAAYYFLKRAWGSRQITLTDEGLNGLHLHVTNEREEAHIGFVEITLWKEPQTVVARAEVPCSIDGRGRQLLNVDEILGGFYDVSYAYRFGPPHHDVVAATLLDSQRQSVSEAFHFIRRRESIVAAASVQATAVLISETEVLVTLQSDRFLHNVRLSAKGYLPDDNYFHLPPGRSKVIRCVSTSAPTKPFRADVEALNFDGDIAVTVQQNHAEEGHRCRRH